MLKQPGIIHSLGTHDVLTALIVEQAGFETGFCRRVWHQRLHAGPAGTEFSQHVRMAEAVRVCIPVIADGDTGYGDLRVLEAPGKPLSASWGSGQGRGNAA